MAQRVEIPRKVWWQTLLAMGAKLCAALSALLATIGLLVVLYIAVISFMPLSITFDRAARFDPGSVTA